ncbi:MAG: hypothetical protein JXL97_12905 [Bacteroidales bacterium]|nr:hypothetical protein [Bacteroidales bacterium]
MKTILRLALFALFVVLMSNCNKYSFKNIEDVKLRVNFTSADTKGNLIDMTYQTPENYFVALKSVTLVGKNETPDFLIFEEDNLSQSLVFDFTDVATTHSLMQGTDVPDGEYSSIKIEIYYLQMKLNIASSTAVEERNIRIYLSDDAETEAGLHQPGDMTQIDESNLEVGWLLGNGVIPDMTPISPRADAYTIASDGVSWLDFAGKNAANYGPFGDVDFMTSAPHPVYWCEIPFTLVDNDEENIILDFNVNNCWQFEDKSNDGYFGGDDLGFPEPTAWQMVMPEMTVTLE